MGPSALLEHRLAIMTNWALFAGFGICFVLSGFSHDDPSIGLFGFALFVRALSPTSSSTGFSMLASAICRSRWALQRSSSAR